MSDIADVLAEHMFVPIKLRIEGRICTCGVPNGPLENFGTDAAAHRAHVATVLEPLIRARIRKEVRRIAGELPFAAYVSWGPIEYATWVEQQAPEIEGADQ